MCNLENVKRIEERLGIAHNQQPDLDYVSRLTRLDNEDRRDDQYRLMSWFALSGLVVYPCLVIISDALNLDKASKFIADMSNIYFPSMSAIVMMLFGSSAYKSKFTGSDNEHNNKPN